jgi:predicted nucleic acid-binding protein
MGLQERTAQAVIAVDTSVLSLAVRRPARGAYREHPAAVRLRRAVEEGLPVVVPGICLQEILSGVRDTKQFERLASLMAPYPILVATRADHVAAARIANACRAAGIAASTVDSLIAALATRHRARLLTTDNDFERIRPYCALGLESY